MQGDSKDGRRRPRAHRAAVESLEGRRLMASADPVVSAMVVHPGVDEAPRVVDARLVTVGAAPGHGKAPTKGVSVTFSEPMDRSTVADPRNYVLIDASKKVSAKNLKASVVGLKAASYDEATRTVTLATRGRLDPSRSYVVSNIDVTNPLRTPGDLARFVAMQGRIRDASGTSVVGPTGSNGFSALVKKG